MKTRYNVQSFYLVQNDTDNFSVFNALTDKSILSDASASEALDFLLANSPLHPAISFIQSQPDMATQSTAGNTDSLNDSYSFYCADLSGDCQGLDFGFIGDSNYSYYYNGSEDLYDPYNSAIQLEFDFSSKNNPHKITESLKKILREEIDSSDWKEFPEDSE